MNGRSGKDQGAQDGLFLDDARVVLDARDARQAIGQLRKIGDAAGGFELAPARQIFHQRDHVNGLLLLAQLNHALENLAVLRKKEILRADFFDGGVERVIVEDDGAENAALGFEIVRKRPFERSVAGHHSPFIRLRLSRKALAGAREPPRAPRTPARNFFVM